MGRRFLAIAIAGITIIAFSGSVAGKRPESPSMWVNAFEMQPIDTETGSYITGEIQVVTERPGKAGVRGVAGAVVTGQLIDPAGNVSELSFRTRGQGYGTFRDEIPGPGPYEFMIISITKSNLVYDDTIVGPDVDFAVTIVPPPAVYITDAADGAYHRIQQFTQEGAFVRSWNVTSSSSTNEFFYGRAVVVDSMGYVYIAVNSYAIGVLEPCELRKYTAYGEFVDTIGSCGTGAGQFTQPREMAVDSNDNVYVIDHREGPDRIQVFSSSGVFLLTIDADEDLENMFDIAISKPDLNGTEFIYVTDIHAEIVGKYSLTGTYILSWEDQSNSPGDLNRPSGIDVDSTGLVYVLDQDNQVQRFEGDGTFVSEWYPVNNPGEIAIDWTDRVYLGSGHDIHKYTADGVLLHQWGAPGSDPGQFTTIQSIATYR